MITIIISAIKGPMLSALSGCLGESGLGNDSYFRNIFGVDIPKGLPSNRETSLSSMLSTSWGTAGYAWIGSRRHTKHLRLISSNGPTRGMRPCPLGGAIVLGPWA